MMTRQTYPAKPASIDQETYPILTTHWPSVAPNWKYVGEVTTVIVRRLASQQTADGDQEAA